jgi:basic membrane protein A
MNSKFKFCLVLLATAAMSALFFSSCKREWKPGLPLEKKNVKIGVLHITDPFLENSGYSYAHQTGVWEMQRALGLNDDQILYKINVDSQDSLYTEGRIRELIAQGANIIIATSWGYMDTCEKLAKEFPSVIFAHASGYKYNETNFTNFFGRVYQARYLSGMVAGMKTKTNTIGYVAAWGIENSEVTSGLNAFALGVKRVNPLAKIYVVVTYSWFDPMGEAAAARALIAAGCDIIAQHCDTANPQIEAQSAGVWGIGYNTNMEKDAPEAVLTSVLWHWGAYYTALVQSVINGTFNTTPWYGSLKDGIIDIAPLNNNMIWEADIFVKLDEKRQMIKSGEYFIFTGVMETNDNRIIGEEGKVFSDEKIRNEINWYYRTIAQLF